MCRTRITSPTTALTTTRAPVLTARQTFFAAFLILHQRLIDSTPPRQVGFPARIHQAPPPDRDQCSLATAIVPCAALKARPRDLTNSSFDHILAFEDQGGTQAKDPVPDAHPTQHEHIGPASQDRLVSLAGPYRDSLVQVMQ